MIQVEPFDGDGTNGDSPCAGRLTNFQSAIKSNAVQQIH